MKSLSAFELQEWAATNKPYVVVDVREPDEFANFNIGGKLIPLALIASEVDQIPTDLPVVMVCRSGKRSEMAIRILESVQAYQNLYNLSGGLLEFQRLEKLKS